MRAAIALGLVLALAAPPAWAAERPAEDPFPIYALAPCGFAAGYLLGGRPDRALLVPAGIYAATGAGAVIGFMNAWQRSSIKRPVESIMGLLLGPLGGAAAGFGLTGGFALLDQATLAPPAGPWAAPLLSLGAVGAIAGLGYLQHKPAIDRSLTSP